MRGLQERRAKNGAPHDSPIERKPQLMMKHAANVNALALTC
jgi:hypothetical protein